MAVTLRIGCGCEESTDPCEWQCGCPDGGCLVASARGEGGNGPTSGPCVDFIGATSTGARTTGVYACTGGADDEGTWTWPGGSHFKPANQPNVGPCYGASGTSFTAFLSRGDTMSCKAGSWGSSVSCDFRCCPQAAP